MNKTMKHKNQSKESFSDSECISEQVDDNKYKKPYIQRLLNFQMENNRILINLACRVVHQVAKDLNWQVTEDKKEGKWDVCWTDIPIHTDCLIRMHFFQKINYMPGMTSIARKNLLGLNLNAMKNNYPDQYNFFPLTWMLPDMYSQFRRHILLQNKKNTVFIAKPQASSQGNGIFLSNCIEDFENGQHYVVQQYISDPYTIDGLKFDLRLYVLVAGTNPLRLYFYKEGLARFATEKYKPPNKNNFKSQFTHLTNYAINKRNPIFQFSKSQQSGTGHKRSYSAVKVTMANMGVDVLQLQQKIKDVIIKTIITGLPILSHQYAWSQPQQYYGNMCFHILGFDILIDSKLNPILLQVNHTPSFATDSPLDRKIKFQLIKDTLILMNINSSTKQTLFLRSKIYNDRRIDTGQRQVHNHSVRSTEIQKAQQQRNKYQKDHLGGYCLLYPTNNQNLQSKYNKLIQSAQNIVNNKSPQKYFTLTDTHRSNSPFFQRPRKKIYSKPIGLRLGPIYSGWNKDYNPIIEQHKNLKLKKYINIGKNKSLMRKRQGSYIKTKLFDASSCVFKADIYSKDPFQPTLFLMETQK